MRILSAGVFILAMAFVPAAADEQPDNDGLAIDASRLDLIVDQSEEALKLLVPQAKDGQFAVETGQAAFAELAGAVLRYNFLQDQACNAGVVARRLCTGPYRPAWLNAGAAHSNAQLRAMIDEASARLVPLWEALCDKGRPLAHDESFCRIE
jgi:hypothetical protein